MGANSGNDNYVPLAHLLSRAAVCVQQATPRCRQQCLTCGGSGGGELCSLGDAVGI